MSTDGHRIYPGAVLIGVLAQMLVLSLFCFAVAMLPKILGRDVDRQITIVLIILGGAFAATLAGYVTASRSPSAPALNAILVGVILSLAPIVVTLTVLVRRLLGIVDSLQITTGGLLWGFLWTLAVISFCHLGSRFYALTVRDALERTNV